MARPLFTSALCLLTFLAFSAFALRATESTTTTTAPPSSDPSAEFLIAGDSLPDYGTFKSKNYAGYIDLPEGRKGFFWFIESENSPANDPVVLWLNGGPGCSSIYGTLQESGPHTMRGPPYKFRENNFSWTSMASMLYLESPPGVGFSLDPTNALWNDKTTAVANYDFLKGFFAKFPQFATQPFHIGGESYGGHYVPQLANEILEGDDHALLARFKGFMVGNPCTGAECRNDQEKIVGLEEYMRAHGFAALNTSIGPVIAPTDGEVEYDPYDILVPTCPNVNMMNMVSWNHPVTNALKNKLSDDHRKYIKAQDAKRAAGEVVGPPYPWGPCEAEHVHDWINQANIKAAIHASPTKEWHSCGGIAYNYTDVAIPVIPLYQKFFANETLNWKIMFYSGTADTIVNFIATQTVVEGFGRPLVKNQFRPWHYPYVWNSTWPVLGGFYLEWDKVSWAGVRDAGHMVPMFNPPAAHGLFKSFLTIGRPGLM